VGDSGEAFAARSKADGVRYVSSYLVVSGVLRREASCRRTIPYSIPLMVVNEIPARERRDGFSRAAICSGGDVPLPIPQRMLLLLPRKKRA